MTPTIAEPPSHKSTELAVVNAQNAVQIFTGGGLNALLDGIEEKVRAIQLDPSTAEGRDEIRSVAYRVARTKTALDAEGKKLTEGWREATKKVNDERKRSLERLDALAEEIRKPLTDFENKETVRVGAHEDAIKELSFLLATFRLDQNVNADVLEAHLGDYSALHADRNWEEFGPRAAKVREETVTYISAAIQSRRKYEAEQAELARLRTAEAERLQRERDEKLKAEAAESARVAAERKAKEEANAEAKRVIEAAENERRRVAAEVERVRLENERVQREAETARQREQDARLAAEKRAKESEDARAASEARAERERMEAAERAALQLREAEERYKREAEAAATRERERFEKERKAEEDARLKREANAKLRAKIRAELIEDLAEKSATEIADALMDGKVRHIQVVF